MVMASTQMVGYVARHALAVVRHEHALLRFAIQQHIRIECAKRRGVSITYPYHIYRWVTTKQSRYELLRSVLIEQEAYLQGTIHSCSCSRMTARIFSSGEM